MNKIFKVVWSKTKECYVVVSEVAKNNGGKKKVLASVLATLAIMGTGAQMGTPVQAGANNSGNAVNLWADKKLDGSNNTANTVGANSVAVGNNLVAGSASTTPTGRLGGTAIAIGVDSQAKDDRNIAIGYNNTTEGQDSVAMGSNVIAGTGQSIAIGSTNTDPNGVKTQTIARGKVTMKNGRPEPAAAIAIGSGAQALDGSGVLAMGQLAYASGNNNVAIGTSTIVNGSNATAIGSTAQALGKSSAAYGTQAFANGLGAVAVGPGANAGVSNSTGTEDGAREGATAVGRGSRATDKAATAIGWSANASKQNATALGYGSAANIAGGVALGSESKTTKDAGETGYNPATGRTNDYNNLTNNTNAALASTRAAVSIGDDSASVTRQLTGLAAGTQDTDAVNVAQLKAVNLKFAGDSTQVTGSTDVRLNDGTFNVNGDGTLISTEATATGIKVKAKVGGTITNDPSNDGKAKAPTTDGIATTTNVTNAINNSGWKVTSSNNGGTTNGTSIEKVSPGDKVTFSAGKNIVLDQAGKQFTYSLNKDVDLTNAGSLTIGDTKINNAGMTITGGPSITKTGIDAGSKKITNVTAGTADTDAVNVKQLKDTEKHIKSGTYAVANDGSVTLKYVDGNGTEQTETAKITGIAKKSKVINGKNTTVEEGTDTTDNSVTYKVNVKGDLADISSITNGTGSGKISFEGDQVVKVGGDHPISFDGKGGYVTGLQNKDWDITNPTVVSGRAATEDQLKKVSDGFNNTVKLTGNSGATGTQKLNQDNGLSFGVVGADNGKYITTTASGSNVVADLSTDAKAKLNSKVVVAGSGAATVATPTVTTNPDGSTVTTYTVHVDPATATAASTESVVKKAVTGDTNIADISVADGKATGDVGAKYEVSVSRNAVKDAAREAVTVNNGGTTTGGTYTADTNNPITVNTVKDDTNHNTTYEVKFDGNKAAKQIPLTYKANGNGAKTVTLEKGLDFTNGTNTTAEIDNEGVVKYNLNKDVDLSNTGSLTVGGTTVNNGGITIKAPTTPGTTTTDVKLTNTGLDNGGNKIVNVAEGKADTDAVNVKQLKDAKTVLADGKNTKKSGTGTAADPYKVNVEGDLTGISSITNDGTNNGKISFGPNKTVTVDGNHSITLNASTGTIGGLQNKTFDPTNITSGQAATEDQLKSVHDTLKASELHIAPTESNRTGEHIAGAATSNTAAGAAANAYKYDATTKQVVLEYNDGTGANKTGTKAVIDLSNLPTGGDMSSFKVTSSAESTTVGTHAGDTSQEIKNGKSVDFQAGKNMTVKQTNDTNGNTTINYALNKDLDVESVHVGKDGKDGKIGIDGKDGVDGLDGTNRVDIHVEKGAKGVDGTDGHDGVNGHNGKDGMTRIVYEDKGGKQEVATLNDGMKYAGDDAQGTDKTKVIAKKLNETLDVIGGATKADLTTDNIGVNNDGNGKLLVQLSKNLKGINTIKNGNTTITLNDTPSTTTPAVTITGGNLSLGNGTTNNKIVNVAPGTDDTDAVNVKQLKDAKTVLADGKNTKKSGTGTAADPYKVNVEGDLTEITSITNKADASGNNAGKITFSPNQTVTVSGDHNISLNGKTGDITGLTNTTIPTTAGSDFATKGRAATEEQLKIVNDKFNNKINLGADGSTETTKFALDNTGGIKFNIKGDGSGASGANQYISTTANGSDIKVDLTDDAKAKLNKSYNVTSNDNSVQVKSTTTNGVTTFDLKVAPAAGTTSTWDIKSSADTANGGATATGHETNAKTIANTNSVEMIAGKNLTVKQTSDTNGAKVEFALSDEIAVGKDGTNGVDGKIGVNGKDGASVVINGKDGSIGLTGAPGTPGAPGASATLKVKDGVPGVDGAPGTNLTRIVYTDKNNVEHEVATHDDGMKFAGDDGQANQATNANVIKKHLNNVVDIIGGATKTDLTTNNIGVNNDGNGKLLVQLSKNLNGINTVKNGNTTITLNDAPGGATNTPAVTISGGDLSVGGNKVTNVDDGTDNNDAVNVKQLKAAKTEVKAGKNVVVTSETSTTDGHTTYTVNASTPAVYTKPDGTKLIKQPDGTFKDENGNAYTGSVIASFEDGTGATTGGNMIVNNIGSAIKTQTGGDFLTKLDNANTATPNAAVNVSDLKNTADALKSNELHIRPTTSGRTGETVNKNTAGTAESYKYDAATKSVTLKYNDGTGAGVTGTEAKIDLSGLADQITSGYTFSTNAKGNLADGTTATATALGNGKTVSFAAGKNLTVEQNIDATTGEHTYTYALSDKITAGKDGVNGKDGSVGVTGKDGSSIVINGADGSIGMTGPKGQDGKDGINGRDGANLSMTSAKGEQVLVNRDPAHNADTDKAERIVYVPKDASGNPIQDANGKNIVREVATMDDGLKFTGNNESTENKHKLGSLVKVQGEGVTENTTTNKLEANGEEFKSASGNIAVVADSIDKLTVKLNKNLAGINKISNGGSSITLNDTPGGATNTPAVTITGGNLSMGDSTTKNKIVNLAPGTDDNDAVNVKQLKDAKTVLADGKNTKKTGTGTAADPYKVNVEGDLTDITSITNKADASGNAGKITFSPNQTVTVSGDHNITLDAGSGHIGGLTNLTFNPNSYTSGQAATEDQLKSVHDTLKANERHIAPTTVAAGSTETKGGTANAAGTANVYKYDAASKTVTLSYNDGNGNAVTDTKAVIDLSNLSTGGTGASSWNIASDKVSATEGAVATGSAGTQNIADGKTVTMKAGKNLTVNQSNDGAGNASVAFSLDKNLENLDKVVVNGNDGATGQAGVSIVGPKGANGVDGNDGKVGIAGKDGKDAVSISGKDGVGHIGLQGPKGTPGTPGADGANLDITTDHGTQTLVKPEANNDNKSERIVYVPKDANGNPLKDTDGNTIKREVATMDDGLKFAGDDGQANQATNANVIKKQLNNVVDIIGGATKADLTTNNIGVNNDGNGKLLVQLSKNLKGLNSLQLGGNTIQSNGDNITFTTNGGTTKTVATTDQLWTIQANGTDVPAKSGKVNLVAGDHITITPDAANGKMTISATGFGSMDGFNVKTSAESATVGTHAGDTTENIKNGKTVDMQAGKNLVVTQTNDGNGNTTVNYALNKDVDLGTNGSLKTGDTTINNDGFKNGNTTVGSNGMTIKDPTDPTKTVSLTKDGLNNGGNQITNVASGGNVDTNAANIGDIKRLAKDTRIKDGTYTVDNNGTVELTYVDGAGNQVKDASGNAITAKITGLTTLDSTRVNVAVNETGSGKAVGSTTPVKVTKGTEFVAGNNLIVERKAHTGNDLDNSVVYSLNKDLKGIETIQNGDNTKITLHNVPTGAIDPTAVTINGGNINMGGNRIVNVAPAKAGTDAVNLDQLKAARTKVTSNDGTVSVNRSENTATGEITYDLHVTPGQSPDLTRITNKVDQLGEEIGRVGAQGAALSALKPIQYDPLEPTQIMAGYGNYRGNSAVALGVAHYKNESTLIHGGVSWAGGSSHMMANAGVTWKVGNRDSEAAVADRYRKGPISSAYAMQQEMAAMKAQNAGLKGEVSDLKAENEQMKAQIAAMMAKLGL